MKKFVIVLLIATFFQINNASAEIPFTLIYWIRGKVNDASGFSANGRKIYFENDGAYDIIGAEGASGKPNHFLINAGEARVPLVIGEKYQVFTEVADGYGVGPVEVEILGMGMEDMGTLALALGKGVSTVRAARIDAEALPEIKIWFGKRVYQKTLVEKGKLIFYIPQKPKIKMKVNIAKPYALSTLAASYTMTIDDEATYTFKEKKIAATLAELELTLPEKLEPGKHVFKFQAKSSGAVKAASTALETATVTVTGGDLRILDTPISYPSPYNPSRGKLVTFQYTLSNDANIDLFIFDISGRIVKKISINAGEDGGSGQLNKVTWNGIAEQGTVAGSGVYLVNIVARDDKKVLSKIKLTIYR